ncbi:DUF551 domain-containing protein [Klebsiella pneumoniae]|nr:DUF551 domain-containing protein [Klebsiella pneumoniae]
MTSKLTRERLAEIAQFGFSSAIMPANDFEIKELARMALAAMDSEPVTVPEHITYISEPTILNILANDDSSSMANAARLLAYEVRFWRSFPLYRHAQPVPVVPDDVLAAIQKVARIRLDLNGFDGDRRGIADCLGNAEEALIEVVNRCAAMLAAAPQSPGSEPATVLGKWIPVSERMPDVGDIVLTAMGGSVNVGEMERSGANYRYFTSVISGRELPVTHWMPLPAAPQEVK